MLNRLLIFFEIGERTLTLRYFLRKALLTTGAE
jgi:hypothetical protein